MKNIVSGFLACFLPFAAVHFITLVMTPHAYFSTTTDAPAFLAATGINWLTLDPLLIWHLPGYTWMQVSALILCLTGFPETSLSSFQIWGMVFQGVCLLAVSLWVGGLKSPSDLGFLRLLCLCALCATMPAALAYSRIWGHNYPLSLMCAPLAVGLYVLAKRFPVARWVPLLTLAGLGFMAANFMTLACIIFAVIIAFGVRCLQGGVEIHLFASENPVHRVLIVICMYFTLWSVLNVGVYFIRGIVGQGLSLAVMVGITGLLSAFATLLACRPMGAAFSKYPGLAGVIVSIILGWLIGANVVSPFWGQSLVAAAIDKGGAAAGLDFDARMSLVKPYEFIRLHAWNLLFIWAPIVSVFLFLRKKTDTFLPLVVVLGVGLTFVTTFDVSFRLDQEFDVLRNFGITPMRYYLGLPILVGCVFLFATERDAPWRRVTILCMVVICLFSILQYHRSCYLAEKMSFERALLDEIVDQHLAQSSENVVVAVRVNSPDRANLLYAYNNYRTPGRWQRVQRTSLMDGRFIYLGDVSQVTSEGEEQQRLALRKAAHGRTGKALVLSSGSLPYMEPYGTTPLAEVSLGIFSLEP